MPLIQENVGGTTYYYTPEDNIKPNHEDPNIRNHGSQSTDKIAHNSVLSRRIQSPNQLVSTSQQPNHLFSVYSGPSSFLQSCTGQQGSTFFMNEDIRADLVQRNSVALSTSDPASFPGTASSLICNIYKINLLMQFKELSFNLRLYNKLLHVLITMYKRNLL